jgi:hypothetical protein
LWTSSFYKRCLRGFTAAAAENTNKQSSGSMTNNFKCLLSDMSTGESDSKFKFVTSG